MLRELQKKLWKAGATTLADATHPLGGARANKHAHLVQFVEAACRDRDKPQNRFYAPDVAHRLELLGL